MIFYYHSSLSGASFSSRPCFLSGEILPVNSVVCISGIATLNPKPSTLNSKSFLRSVLVILGSCIISEQCGHPCWNYLELVREPYNKKCKRVLLSLGIRV